MSDDIYAYFDFWKRRIDLKLKSLIPLRKKFNNPLLKAIHYTLFNGGKRLRPILCIAGAESAGGKGEDVLPFACAIEMIHTYSLIHDDLPCMDDSDTRRGRPSCHRAFNEAIAVLAGDALLTEGFRIMTDPRLYKKYIRKHLFEAVNLISTAIGINGMVGGQVLDIGIKGSIKPRIGHLTRINLKKTAMLISASVASGVILVSGNGGLLRAVQSYGINLGMAFQLMDDMMDRERDEPSIPAIYGDSIAKKAFLRYIKRSKQALIGARQRTSLLEGIIDYIFGKIITDVSTS